MNNTDIQVAVHPDGTGTVVIGGTDISSAVSEVRLIARPGRGTIVELELPGAKAAFTAIDVDLDRRTHTALVALGWTPPSEEPADRVTDSIKEPPGPEMMRDPVTTEPGCQHVDCTLDHPHAGPAVLAPREA